MHSFPFSKKINFISALLLSFLVCYFSITLTSCIVNEEKKAISTVEKFISSTKANDLQTIKDIAPFFLDFTESDQKILIEGFASSFANPASLSAIKNSADNNYIVEAIFMQNDGSSMTFSFPCKKNENNSWIILSNITTSIEYPYFEFDGE